MSYNLLEEKWIPILRIDGSPDRVGIIEALTKANQIREIVLASPLDSFAVHRFMLTLLYWKAALAGGVHRVRESLLSDGKIPAAVLDGVIKEEPCFDLFDEHSPFLQDPTVRNEKKSEKKSAGSFFAELATGTNVAHFHHGDDDGLRLCLPCTVLGMLRVVPWSQAGGAGITPSVHNAPPIMAVAAGDSLAMTLGLNFVPLEGKPGDPVWSGHFKPTSPAAPIPFLEALTWNPRRMLLPAPSSGLCWYCGQRGEPTVGPGIVYLKNAETKGIKNGGKAVPFHWRDPAAFYGADDYRTVKSADQDAAEDNRDLRWLAESRSSVVMANQDHHGWLLMVPCTNPANNKTFDHRLIETDAVSSDAISDLVPAAKRLPGPSGLDGWRVPKPGAPRGITVFVQAAARLFTSADWATLANAAHRDMHEAPAAFDVFAGLYWGLRNAKAGRLPSRNVAWLTVKVMAAVPAHARVLHPHARFCPLDVMLRRQPRRTSRYPLSFPVGARLEDALRGALHRNFRQRDPEPVDWAGLCHGLDRLLD
ncbi:MAG TPA: type I-E CRISPR-associated protein Cse1/CasA [Terriglobia bacterium]|nr:type I-E CRISPR-associated protein Cse1/CasA [Terriglobia bacterium]